MPDFSLPSFWFQWQQPQHEAEPRSAALRSVCREAACVTGTLGFGFQTVSYSGASSHKALPQPAPTVHTPFCQLPKMLHKSYRDLDQNNKVAFGLHALTRNGRLRGSGHKARRLLSLCCRLPLCHHSSSKRMGCCERLLLAFWRTGIHSYRGLFGRASEPQNTITRRRAAGARKNARGRQKGQVS